MNKNQKRILVAVIAVLVAMIAYPPLHVVRGGSEISMGYGWFFDYSKRGNITINVFMLLIQWIGVLVVGGIAFFLTKDISSSQQSKIVTTSKETTGEKIDENIYASIIGEKNCFYYLEKFKEFDRQVSGLNASWNWAAFFGAWTWALYRKMYGWFFACFGILFISSIFEREGLSVLGLFLFFVPWIAFTIFANSLYHLNIKKKITAAQLTMKDEIILSEYLRHKGGVHTWVIYVAAGLLGLGTIGIVAAIAISYLDKQTDAGLKVAWLLVIIIAIGVIIWVIYNVIKRAKKDNTEKYVYHTEQADARALEEARRRAIYPISEVTQKNEEFIALLKSTVKENRLDIIPNEELFKICNRARSIAAFSNTLDIELSKAINTLLEEIKKRGLTQDSTTPQEISDYEDSAFTKKADKERVQARVTLAIIGIIVIVIAVVVVFSVIKSNQSETADKYFGIGYNDIKMGQYQKAIESFNEAIRLKPDYAEAYHNIGIAHENLGNYNLAIQDYNKAIELNPQEASAYCGRGNAYSNLGNYNLAIEDYNEAIRLKPDYAEAYNNRAVVFFIQGNDNLGCRDAQKACELGNCKTLEWAKGKEDCR